jgi:hypothetical protein
MPCTFLRQVLVGEIGEEIQRVARLRRSTFLFHTLSVAITRAHLERALVSFPLLFPMSK